MPNKRVSKTKTTKGRTTTITKGRTYGPKSSHATKKRVVKTKSPAGKTVQKTKRYSPKRTKSPLRKSLLEKGFVVGGSVKKTVNKSTTDGARGKVKAKWSKTGARKKTKY